MQRLTMVKAVFVGLVVLTALSRPASASDVSTVRKQVGLQRGVCLVLGDPELALALAAGGDVLVYTQAPDPKQAAALRRSADERAVLGAAAGPPPTSVQAEPVSARSRQRPGSEKP